MFRAENSGFCARVPLCLCGNAARRAMRTRAAPKAGKRRRVRHHRRAGGQKSRARPRGAGPNRQGAFLFWPTSPPPPRFLPPYRRRRRCGAAKGPPGPACARPAAGPGLCAPCRLPRGQARSRKSAHSKNPRPRVTGLGVLLSSGRGPVALFSAVRGFAQKSKAHPAVCAKPKPTSLAGGCPAMGFMLPSSATAGGLQSLHGHRAPDDWLVGFNVGATNRTGQAVAVFRARRRAGRPAKTGGGAPRRVTARYRTALPGARQTPRSPRPALHHPLQCPKTLRRFLPSRA